jgi:hypothetical protein
MALITVSGHCKDPSGANIAGHVVFTLCNFGANIPRVIGTNAMVPVSVTVDAAANGSWSTSIQGNDSIDPGAANTPPTTFYNVAFLDANKNIIQILPFNFTGAGPNNLDSQAPLNTIPSPTTPPNNAALLAANQTFTGNDTFQGTTTLGATLIGSLSGSITGSPNFTGTPEFSGGISADGTHIETIPSTTSTLVDLATSQTITGNKIFPSGTLSATNATLASPSTTGTDSGTETFQNKTLTGAASGNSVSLLKFLGPSGALTGNSADQTYFTYTLPANTLQTNKGIRITAVSKHTTGTASTTFRLSFGGTLTATVGAGAAANAPIKAVYELFNNAATNAQTITSTVLNHAGGNLFLTYDTAAIDTTAGVTINVTFNVANTDQWTPEMFFVELIQ